MHAAGVRCSIKISRIVSMVAIEEIPDNQEKQECSQCRPNRERPGFTRGRLLAYAVPDHSRTDQDE